jgi:hypothetical protein
MGKYDHLSKEELIQRIERLEADLEKATLTPRAITNLRCAKASIRSTS